MVTKINDPIPEKDHVSRYIGFSHIEEDGRINVTAFRLREDEQYLSTNWLEFFSNRPKVEQIKEIKKVFASKLNKVGIQAKIAVLNVGNLQSYIFLESPDKKKIFVKHEPEDQDMSHCGIYGLNFDDDVIFRHDS